MAKAYRREEKRASKKTNKNDDAEDDYDLINSMNLRQKR